MGANDIGIGIIGCGDGGLSNGRALAEVRGAKVVALCDTDRTRQIQAHALLGWGILNLSGDYGDLVRERSVDLVIVATPDHQHLEPAVAALAAGKHVFVEKPLATTLEGVRAFRELAKQYPGRIWFGEKYSFARPVEAALGQREALGEFLWGSTFYAMRDCDRIMGRGKWRTETRYNPCAGGLSHNFMTALLLVVSRIKRIRATGRVLAYRELERHGGYDTMEGTIEFENGRLLNWVVCLAVTGGDSPFGHRTVAHTFQFEHGSLTYGPVPASDRLTVNGSMVWFTLEPPENNWLGYNVKTLYAGMHRNIIAAIRGTAEPRHTIEQGINVAAACALAFDSAQQDGAWMEVPY